MFDAPQEACISDMFKRWSCESHLVQPKFSLMMTTAKDWLGFDWLRRDDTKPHQVIPSLIF